MSQPEVVFSCPECGESLVTLLPGRSWSTFCENGHPAGPIAREKWGQPMMLCSRLLTRVRRGELLMNGWDAHLLFEERLERYLFGEGWVPLHGPYHRKVG